jgi:hypothetical protein
MADQFRRLFFIVVTEGSPAPTAAIAVEAPAIRRGLFKLLNLTQSGLKSGSDVLGCILCRRERCYHGAKFERSRGSPPSVAIS